MQNREEIEKLYGNYLDGFISEVNPLTSRAEILSQMDIHPIVFEARTVGILGMNMKKTAVGSVAIIRLIFLEKAYRGDRMAGILEQLFDQFARDGFTHVESWTLPHISEWLKERWKLKPKIFVYHEHLESLRKTIRDLKMQKI